ncbi:hypothetical protein QTI51_24640 [Variovorax sp. J22G73]|uniref:hypothetical protein n=1 Tax=unclassified Variovorax TaxID=663243 RepID=UPI002577751A|nr:MULTISPECIES: hypothetical protein [unclassified Variovorax]MDM0007889.1 hypothetical protein [Variovorax sp. J22R203]MDM0100488.1 hypothetical protein [Variovorax sp. J22G73]
MKKSTLPLNLAKLCAQVANEQTRRQTWELGHALKREFEKRIADGETVEAAEIELTQRLKAAVIQQMRR